MIPKNATNARQGTCVCPAWSCIAQLVYAIRCLSRNEAKIAQVMRGALHRPIEGAKDWYRVAVELQRSVSAFLHVRDHAGFWGAAVPVLVYEGWDSVTFYVLRPGAPGEGGCEDCTLQTL